MTNGNAPFADDDEPDVTMTDGGEGGPGEDPDFDEAGEGVDDAPRDEEHSTMTDRDHPLKQGMTPSGYDEYGGGADRTNSPEKMHERQSEKSEKQEYPSEHSSGDRRRADRRRSGGGARS